ncbi:hypothetical protein FRB93_012882 [Tulasnella sp. JGI-2019a]|nr:hypothetical protein FRB93_012882 [Tulasnella sp. JGI-2019a]
MVAKMPVQDWSRTGLRPVPNLSVFSSKYTHDSRSLVYQNTEGQLGGSGAVTDDTSDECDGERNSPPNVLATKRKHAVAFGSDVPQGSTPDLNPNASTSECDQQLGCESKLWVWRPLGDWVKRYSNSIASGDIVTSRDLENTQDRVMQDYLKEVARSPRLESWHTWTTNKGALVHSGEWKSEEAEDQEMDQ